MSYRYCIGIDPGVNTGICIWNKDEKVIYMIRTVKIHEAMKIVEQWIKCWGAPLVSVRVEDARQAVYGRHKDANKAQGAGSVKRDCSVWEDFLIAINADFTMTRPNKRMTKLSVPAFRAMTNWTGVTSIHARDACMLVYGM